VIKGEKNYDTLSAEGTSEAIGSCCGGGEKASRVKTRFYTR